MTTTKPLTIITGASSGIGAATAQAFREVDVLQRSSPGRWVALASLRICLRWLVAFAALSLVLFQAQAASQSQLFSDLRPYSADDPPGPGFTDAQKQEQRIAGLKILADLRSAYASGTDSFTIPPGDYRFGTAWKGADSFALENFDRDGKRPFRILGQGATLWFDLGPDPAPKVNYMIRLVGCSNITLEGIIIDSDPRGCMDARVTDFDFEGNRIQVEPLTGTQLLINVPTKQDRFVPFKANGHHIAPLYNIDGGWGPADLSYKGFTRTADGKYWFTLKTGVLLKTIRDPAWLAAYGPEGILGKGDVLTFLWSVSFSMHLQDCKHITVRDCSVYAAKSVTYETGYGGNHWLNCRFMPRPRTNQLLGGEGRMSSECMVGSLVDGAIHQRATDDAFMYRALWRHAVGVAPDSITFQENVPGLLAPGHKAELFHAKTKAYLGQLTVESVRNKRTVVFKEPVGETYANSTAVFSDHLNAGWTVRNSRFLDCYQCTPLIQCGPGLFENNRVERAGAWVRIHPGVIGKTEGGIPDDLVFRSNVFVDSFVSPPNPGLFVNGEGRPLANLTLEGNLICRTGRAAVDIAHARDVVLKDNILIHPFSGHALRKETKWPELPAFALEDVRGARVENNLVIRRDAAAIVSEKSCKGILKPGNRTLTDADGWLQAFTRELTASHEHDARTIIEKVRAEISKKEQQSNQ